MNPRTASPASAGARPVARPANPAAMSELLRRYPNIAEDERQQLLRFLTQGAQEDIVRATYVAGLEPRLIAFRKDHPEHFPGLRSWVPLALIILVTVVGVLWRVLS
jgi:hypothetical protein